MGGKTSLEGCTKYQKHQMEDILEAYEEVFFGSKRYATQEGIESKDKITLVLSFMKHRTI
jgi:hypothetical protein